MRVKTQRFGELEVDPETLLLMPEGLVGMSEAKRFCLLEESPDRGYKWLQLIDEPGLAFVAVNPYDFYPDYGFEVDGKDADLLGLERPEDAAVLVLLTVGPGGSEITANLVAPVLVCTKTRKAKQVILQDERYSTKHLLVGGALETTGSGVG